MAQQHIWAYGVQSPWSLRSDPLGRISGPGSAKFGQGEDLNSYFVFQAEWLGVLHPPAAAFPVTSPTKVARSTKR